MKTLIYFNAKDKPENMGQSQLVTDVAKFLTERKNFLPKAKVKNDRLTFDVVVPATKNAEATTRKGYALVIEVENDFQN